MATQLRFLCFGAGAIGTYLGGSLALSGQQVTFLERPEMAAGLAVGGLHLRLADGEHHLAQPSVVSSLEEALAIGPYDAAIVAVKSYDTLGLVEMLRTYAADLPPVICFQNGVENESRLAGLLGAERVIAGTVTTAVGRRGVGNIAVEKLRGVGVAGQHPLAGDLVAALSAAGLNAHWYASSGSMKWSKMLTNLLANATSAILNLPAGAVFAHPGLYRLETAQIREALRVMRALDYPVVDLPGTPVRALAWAMGRLPAWMSQPLVARSVGKGRGEKMPSFHIDLYQGRGKSEVDDLNGAVVRFGAQFGLSTPVNRLLNETLLALTHGEIPLDRYSGQPQCLLDEWKKTA